MWWEANATHPWRSRGAVPHHRLKSLVVETWLHAGRVIFLRKSWDVQQQPMSYDGSIFVARVWWKANASHPWRSSDAVPLSSERSDGSSWSREGEVFPPMLSAAGTSLTGGSGFGRRSLGGSTTAGAVGTGLRQGSSNRRSDS